MSDVPYVHISVYEATAQRAEQAERLRDHLLERYAKHDYYLVGLSISTVAMFVVSMLLLNGWAA